VICGTLLGTASDREVNDPLDPAAAGELNQILSTDPIDGVRQPLPRDVGYSSAELGLAEEGGVSSEL